MSDFNGISDADLKAELKRREFQKSIPRPHPVASPDFKALTQMCGDYIDQLDNQGWVDDDLKNYIFESAMEAVFGKDVWKFINSRTR